MKRKRSTPPEFLRDRKKHWTSPGRPKNKQRQRKQKATGLLTPTTRTLNLPPVPPTCISPDEFYGRRGLILIEMGYKTYKDYLGSDEWARIRGNVLIADNHQCRCCGAPATEVHHTSYNIWALRGGTLDDLHAICRKCHKEVEFNGRDKRTPADMVSTFCKKVHLHTSTQRGKTSNPGTEVSIPGGARLVDGGACTVSNNPGRTLAGPIAEPESPEGLPRTKRHEGTVEI